MTLRASLCCRFGREGENARDLGNFLLWSAQTPNFPMSAPATPRLFASCKPSDSGREPAPSRPPCNVCDAGYRPSEQALAYLCLWHRGASAAPGHLFLRYRLRQKSRHFLFAFAGANGSSAPKPARLHFRGHCLPCSLALEGWNEIGWTWPRLNCRRGAWQLL